MYSDVLFLCDYGCEWQYNNNKVLHDTNLNFRKAYSTIISLIQLLYKLVSLRYPTVFYRKLRFSKTTLKVETLFYDYETSYTTYINHNRWHRCLCSGGLRVGGNRSTRRKPTCLTWWPHDYLKWRYRVLNPSQPHCWQN